MGRKAIFLIIILTFMESTKAESLGNDVWVYRVGNSNLLQNWNLACSKSSKGKPYCNLTIVKFSCHAATLNLDSVHEIRGYEANADLAVTSIDFKKKTVEFSFKYLLEKLSCKFWEGNSIAASNKLVCSGIESGSGKVIQYKRVSRDVVSKHKCLKYANPSKKDSAYTKPLNIWFPISPSK